MSKHILIRGRIPANGSFETGTFEGWTTHNNPAIIAVGAYDGTYCASIGPLVYIEQDINNIPVDLIFIFKFHHYGDWSGCFGGDTIKVTVTYSDASTTIFTHEMQMIEKLTWVEVDILSHLTTGKTITKIQFYGSSTLNLIDNIYIGMEVDAISWRETQSCDVAMRAVPTRSSGAKVDTGTYTLTPRNLDIEVRLSEDEKSALGYIYDNDDEVRVVATNASGTWTYYGWFSEKPLIYEYAEQDDDTREWVAKLKFICYSFNYA